jgi:hypothetical protein
VGPEWRSIMATCYALHRDSISVEARFSSLVLTGSGSHPASCTMDAGRGVDQPPLSSTEVKERVEIYLYSPVGPSRPVLGRTLPFTWELL